MEVQGILTLYEIGRRGRPIATIKPGDLGDPSARKNPWGKVTTLWAQIVDVVRESRELERNLLGKAAYRHLGES